MALLAVGEMRGETKKAEIHAVGAAKVELLKEGEVAGVATIAAGTVLNVQGYEPKHLIVDFYGTAPRIASADTDYKDPRAKPPPDFPRLELRDGTVLLDVIVKAVTAGDISVQHRDGAGRVRLAELSADLQRSYGYDPEKARAYFAANQAATDERERHRREAQATASPAPAAAPAADGQNAAPLPAPVEGPLSLTSFFDHKLHRGVVARWTARLYEVTLDPQHADPKAKNFGEGAIPGAALVEVPAGYLVIAASYKDPVGGLVELPIPLAGRTVAYAYSRDFAAIGPGSWRSWWNGSTPDDLQHVPAIRRVPDNSDGWPLTRRTELLDAAGRRSVVVANSGGVMRDAWQLRVDHTNQLPGVGLVSTVEGCFFGWLRENPAPEKTAELSWSDVLAARATRFHLVLEKTVEPKKNLLLFQLADFTSAKREMTPQTEPDSARLLPRYHAAMLEFGPDGLAAELSAQRNGAVKMLPPPAVAAGAQGRTIEKQSILESIELRFISHSPEPTLVELRAVESEREITRPEANRGRSYTKTDPWKSIKRTENRWLDNDAEGALRLTDGRRIYDLRPSGFLGRLELRIYRIEKDALPPRR